MSIKTGLLVISVAVFVLISGSLYVVSQPVPTEADIAQAEIQRYHSYQLADELRQSSDDLTRMARLYAVTGESVTVTTSAAYSPSATARLRVLSTTATSTGTS